MLKTNSPHLVKLDKVIDLILTLASFFLAYYVSKWVSPHLFIERFATLDTYLWMLYIVIPIWLVLLPRYGLYGSLREISVNRLILITSLPIIQAGVLSGAAVFLLKQQALSRGFFITFLMVNLATLVLWKLIVRQILWHLRKEGYNYRGILIIGDRERAKAIRSKLENRKEWGLKVVGIVNVSNHDQNFIGTLEGQPYCGNLSSMRHMLSKHVVDEILITSLDNKNELIGEVVQIAEEIGVRVRVILDLFSSKIFKSTAVDKFGENFALTLHTTHLDTRVAMLKRTMDIILAAFGMIVTAIVSIPIGILIKCTSKGPILFRQRRIGQNGRLFYIYKFRTMHVDAEKRKQELLRHNEMKSVMFKMENDPRLTPCGKFLRKFSLDELPQLFNVLRGDMSLVGPRPPLREEVAQYSPWQRRRLSVKPGLSGFWQVSGRNNVTDFDTVVKQDLEYIDKWSLWLDLKILFKTIFVVIFPHGAK